MTSNCLRSHVQHLPGLQASTKAEGEDGGGHSLSVRGRLVLGCGPQCLDFLRAVGRKDRVVVGEGLGVRGPGSLLRAGPAHPAQVAATGRAGLRGQVLQSGRAVALDVRRDEDLLQVQGNVLVMRPGEEVGHGAEALEGRGHGLVVGSTAGVDGDRAHDAPDLRAHQMSRWTVMGEDTLGGRHNDTPNDTVLGHGSPS